MSRTPPVRIVLALLVAGACRANTAIGALGGDAGPADSTLDSRGTGGTGAGATGGSAIGGSGGSGTGGSTRADAPRDVPVDASGSSDAPREVDAPVPDAGPRALGPCEGGLLQWARRTSGSGRVQVGGAAVSPDGTAWVTGYFFGTVTFWAGQPEETTRAASGADFFGRDFFLLKISPDGALLKFITVTQTCGGVTDRAGGTEGKGVAALADGSILVVGNFTSEVTIGTTTLDAHSAQGMFLARYGADGSPVWVAGATGPWAQACGVLKVGTCDGVCGLQLVALPDGRSRVMGQAGGGTTFRGTTGVTTSFSNTAGPYVAAYAPDGAHEWARVVGGGSSPAVTMSPDGSTFVTSGTALLTRLAADGTPLWTKGPGTGPGMFPNLIGANAVVAFGDGSAITGGSLNGTVVLGPGEPRETVLTVPHTSAYLAGYEADGSLAWARVLPANADSRFRVERLVAFPSGGFALAGLRTSGAGPLSVDTSREGTCGRTTSGMVTGDPLLLARYDAARSIMWGKIDEAGCCGFGTVATSLDGTTLIVSHYNTTLTLGRGEPNETTLPAQDPTTAHAFVAKFGP